MKLSDIPILGAPDLGSLENIATALRNFLNEARPSKQDSLFLGFVNQLYKSSTLEDLYPLHFVMKRSINEENLQAACAIIKKNDWALKERTWDDRTTFSTDFKKLADIPIFLPTIYPGIISAVFLLFLLFPDKKTGLHFYSGLRKRSLKEIILQGPSVDANTLKEMYVGMRTAHKDPPYLKKIEQHLNLSFANFPPPSFRKKDVRAEKEAPPMRSILEAYDYVSHMDNYHPHKHHWDSTPPLFNDEMRETVFKTILLILAYQKDAVTASNYYAKLHGYIGNTFQFHLAHEACIMLLKTTIMFSCASDEKTFFYDSILIQNCLRRIASNLDDFLRNNQKLLHPSGAIYQDSSPLITEQRLLFFTIIWAIERNSANRKQSDDWQTWHILDSIEQITVEDAKHYDAIRHIFLRSMIGPTISFGIVSIVNPIGVNNWNDFYKKYHDEIDSICAAIETKHEKEKIWSKSTIALLFINRADLNAPSDRIAHFQNLRGVVSPSDVHTAKKLKTWISKNPEMIELLPLSLVWSMMILYIASDQIYVQQNGHDTKFFSAIDPNQKAAFAAKKSKRYTLKYYIDNIYRHQYEEIEDLKRALSPLLFIVQQRWGRWGFSFSLKEKWNAFLHETSEALFAYMNATAYHCIEAQPYQNMNNYFEESQKLLTKIYDLENYWISYMDHDANNPNKFEANVREYLLYSKKLTKPT